MTNMSAETELFTTEVAGGAIVFFLVRDRYLRDHAKDDLRHGIVEAFGRIKSKGSRISVAGMFGEGDVATIYETGFTHDIDFTGVFEAPSLTEAYEGIAILEDVGWNTLFKTEWQIGQREFKPVTGSMGRNSESPWIFCALWEWNDAWQEATLEERAKYDLECDEAFSSDINSGISIAGRYRIDFSSSWHHLGIWETPTFNLVTRAMQAHERVADFKFTTSRHYIGRRRNLADYLGVAL